MTRLPSIQAEEHLRHLAQQFAHWRQRRTTLRGRIPQALWAQAVMLVHHLERLRHHRTFSRKDLLQLAKLAPPVRQTVTADEAVFRRTVAGQRIRHYQRLAPLR